MQVEPGLAGGLVRLGGTAVLDEPAEDVADAALAGLVALQARDDAAVDDAAHARRPRPARRPLITWQVEVPMIMTMLAGLDRAAPRATVTWASTLPTATAMPARQAGPAGRLLGEAAGEPAQGCRVARRACRRRSRRSRGAARRGSPAGDSRRPGRCPCSRRCRRCGSSTPRELPDDPVGGLDRGGLRRGRPRGPPPGSAAPWRTPTRWRSGRRSAAARSRRARRAVSLMRSACGWAAWCFQSLT